MTALIDALPNAGTIGIPTTIAADLLALLPRGNSLNVRSSVRLFAPAGPRQTQILMVLSAFRHNDLLSSLANDATMVYAAPVKTGSELLGRLEQTQDRIALILIEKADRSPRTAARSKATSQSGSRASWVNSDSAVRPGRAEVFATG